MGTLIVRLRKKDVAIERALERLSETYDKSDITREALRQYLFKNKNIDINIIGEGNDEPYQLQKIEVSDETIDGLLENALNEF